MTNGHTSPMPFYTLQEVCILLSTRFRAGERIPCTRVTVKRWRDEGLIPWTKFGHRIVYPKAKIDGMLSALAEDGKAIETLKFKQLHRELRGNAAIFDKMAANGKDLRKIVRTLEAKKKNDQEAKEFADDWRKALAEGVKLF